LNNPLKKPNSFAKAVEAYQDAGKILFGFWSSFLTDFLYGCRSSGQFLPPFTSRRVGMEAMEFQAIPGSRARVRGKGNGKSENGQADQFP